MKHISRAIPAILFCMGAALPLAAHADLYGTAILDVSRIALKRADGRPVSAADFSQATVHYQGSRVLATGDRFEINIGPETSQPSDLPLRCHGVPCPITSENNFNPLSGTPTGLFANSDQMQSGGLLTGDLQMRQRSDAGAEQLGSRAYAYAGSSVLVQFKLNQPGTMTIELDAAPFVTTSLPEADRLAGDSSDIGLGLVLSLYNVTTDQTIFFVRPDEISTYSRLSLDANANLERLTYDPGRLTFSFSTGPLNSTDTYGLSISASAYASMTPAPEPSSLAMFCAGILSLLMWQRRKDAAFRQATVS